MAGIAHKLPFAAVAGAMLLAGCGGGGDNGGSTGGLQPAPTPPATVQPLSVSRCLNQTVPGTGRNVAGLVVPDVINLNLSQPAGFPNGRRLQDPVIDVTLAVLFLDLTRHSPTALATVPVNPPANDRPFSASFPFVAPPQGTPPLASGAGGNFNFRTDPASAYVRVDRMGMPAVATALISGNANKDAYNDANPSNDAAGTFVPQLTSNLEALHAGLADDLRGLGLTVCSTP